MTSRIKHERWLLRSRLTSRLLAGAAFGVFIPAQVYAQSNVATETVVVTGTSIRGAQPVGANLITMDRAQIESTGDQSIQQILTDIPGTFNFGGAPQGAQSTPAAIGIHSIGSGSSGATLVLIDGHRMPGQGITEVYPDPNLIPGIALQRVEVLPDGASSIYGSDAVSGVINFVTRKDFTGFESNAQAGAADHYNTAELSLLAGHAWNGGSVMLAYDYSSQSNLMNSSRSFITARQDIRRGAADPSFFTGVAVPQAAGLMATTPAAGPGTSGPYGATIPYPSTGVNFQNFFCPVATIAASGSSPAFYYTPAGDYSGTGFSTSTANQPSQGACDNLNSQTALPSVTAHSALVQYRQEITSTLSFDMEIIYGTHVSTDRLARGTVQAQVFGPTAGAGAGSTATTQAAAAAGEINPFYVGNSSTGTATENIRYDFNSLLGPGAIAKTGLSSTFVTSGLTWDLGNDREIVLSGVMGSSTALVDTIGTVSQAAALLALNGTVNSGGTPGQKSVQDFYAVGTTYTSARVLTTLNALDVWNPVATNKTSKQILATLTDGGNTRYSRQVLQDFSAKFDGPVFALPAGPVKAAIGGEFAHQAFNDSGTADTTAGPSASQSSTYNGANGRQVYSAFAEINAPLVSADMNVPLVQAISVDISGRFDRYSRIGDTTNPKFGVDWVVRDGLKVRGAYGTSFVAANVADSINNPRGGSVSAYTGSLNNPVILFNDARPFNGGAGIAGTWVSTAASCAAGNGTIVNASGVTVATTDPAAAGCKVGFGATNGAGSSAALNVQGGNADLVPATGRNWSIGIDADFGRLLGIDGLTSNVTFWNITYRGLITAAVQQIAPLLTFAPIGGWTPTSPAILNVIAQHPLTSPLQPVTWAIQDSRLHNAFNIWANGLDLAVNYTIPTDSLGLFRVGLSGTQLLRDTQQNGNGTPLLDVKDGKNAPRYPSEELQGRLNLDWSLDALSTKLTVNYMHPQISSVSNFPYNFAGPNRPAGQYHLGALFTMDFNANYTLPAGLAGLPENLTNGMSVSLTVKNLLDAAPPFVPSSATANVAGLNLTVGSPIGRLVTVGLRKSW